MSFRIPIGSLLLAALATTLGTAAPRAQTFRAAPILEARGLDAVTRTVARRDLDRELFGSPWATVVARPPTSWVIVGTPKAAASEGTIPAASKSAGWMRK